MNCKSRQKLYVLVIAHSFVIMFYSVKPDLSHTSGVNWCLFALYPSYFGTAKAYSNTFWGFFLTLAGKSKVFFLHAHPNCQVSVNLNSGIYLCSPLFNRQTWKKIHSHWSLVVIAENPCPITNCPKYAILT